MAETDQSAMDIDPQSGTKRRAPTTEGISPTKKQRTYLDANVTVDNEQEEVKGVSNGPAVSKVQNDMIFPPQSDSNLDISHVNQSKTDLLPPSLPLAHSGHGNAGTPLPAVSQVEQGAEQDSKKIPVPHSYHDPQHRSLPQPSSKADKETTNPTLFMEPFRVQPGTSVGQWKPQYRTLALALMACIFIALQGIITTSSDQTNLALFDNHAREFLTKNQHIIPPKPTSPGSPLVLSDVTLRSFLERNDTGFSLAMAPAFFGFYGYFGVLASWDEHLAVGSPVRFLQSGRLRSLTGASAGAMAAVLLGAGVKPRVAADFCTTVTLDKFNDFPGLGGLFKGDLFEKLMEDFLEENILGSEQNRSLLLLQNSKSPVAVTAFCLQSMHGKVIKSGSMARAARASATFPLLFQPVGWVDRSEGDFDFFTLVDGGINDTAGVAALEALDLSIKGNRLVNLKVGQFTMGNKPPGPNEIPDAEEVLSISIQNLPQCGPWALENGPLALGAAHDAIVASLDLPLFVDETGRHFELHIDTSSFVSL